MKYDVATIDEYIEAIPPDRKEIVLKLISIIKEYFPEIIGNMEYNIPSYIPVCAIASQKHYVSFYVYRNHLVEKYRKELGNLMVGKSCIRFKKMEQMPETTIRKILTDTKAKK